MAGGFRTGGRWHASRCDAAGGHGGGRVSEGLKVVVEYLVDCIAHFVKFSSTFNCKTKMSCKLNAGWG